ncbi:MAG TPA: prolyl oligopeptidase family serine peptidase [Chthoniobacteraceae bacterium]|nr:prolyl oligopeptidase family serine peptidase [Chthoniobacteraceae bacterium]
MGLPFRRKALKTAALLGLLLLLGLAAGTWVLQREWSREAFGGYDPALPLEPEVATLSGSLPFRTEQVTITGLKGERLPLRLFVPETAKKPVPCVVLLYGIGQKMSFFDRIAPIFAEHGVALALPEQYEQGVRRPPGRSPYRRVKGFHLRSSRIVPETRRVVDYLVSRPEIDPGRLHLLGVSYGGIMSSAVLAHEPRLRSGSLIMAGGNLRALLNVLATHYNPGGEWQNAVACGMLARWFDVFEPLRYIGSVAPRPLLFLNVEKDELIPRSSTAALYNAAREPKAQRWYPDVHETISRATVRAMLTDALEWMAAQEGAEHAVATGRTGD